MKVFSIRKKLLSYLMLALVLSWLLIAGLIHKSTSEEVNEIYDAALAGYARVLASLIEHEAQERLQIEQSINLLVNELGQQRINDSAVLSGVLGKYIDEQTSNEDYLELVETEQPQRHPYESKLAFLVRDDRGKVLVRSRNFPAAHVFKAGFLQADMESGEWRFYGLIMPRLKYHLTVAELKETRQELLDEIVMSSVWPVLAVLPMLAVIILQIIRFGLYPLKRVTDHIQQRDPQSLTAITYEGTPKEIMPLVSGINALFERISLALENEKRFTDNAAHELRTPLSVLKTHLQVLQMQIPAEQRQGLDKLNKGVDRAAHLVDQLLWLSRTRHRANQGLQLQAINLADVLADVMRELAGKAIDKDIELVLRENPATDQVMLDEALIRVVLRNIIENAISYVPRNGHIEISLLKQHDKLIFSCVDDGPGIDDSQLAHVCESFYRANQDTQGAGLGLAIVKQILDLQKIRFSLKNNPDSGLRFSFEIDIIA